jgi:hypothetical protein
MQAFCTLGEKKFLTSSPEMDKIKATLLAGGLQVSRPREQIRNNNKYEKVDKKVFVDKGPRFFLPVITK